MSTTLHLQFFMVQAVNYSMIIVKIKCKTHNITNRKRLPWCELINLYNFFHCQCVSPYVMENISARRWSSLDSWEFRELRGLCQHLGSCNISFQFRRHGSRISVSVQKVLCTSLVLIKCKSWVTDFSYSGKEWTLLSVAEQIHRY